jgi:hypothetical protein
MSWPHTNLFRFFHIVKTLSQKEDTGRCIIFVLNLADPGFLSSGLFRLVNKMSNNCFCKFMWLFIGLFIDIVFMIPLLSENEIKYIMYETVCLSVSLLSHFLYLTDANQRIVWILQKWFWLGCFCSSHCATSYSVHCKSIYFTKRSVRTTKHHCVAAGLSLCVQQSLLWVSASAIQPAAYLYDVYDSRQTGLSSIMNTSRLRLHLCVSALTALY